MPGYDRTGPAGAGPHTGRGVGRCRRPSEKTRSVEDPNQGKDTEENGRRRAGGRGRGSGKGERGRGRGRGMGRRASQDLPSSDVTPRRRQAFLQRRIRELTTQLDRVNQLLSDDSPGDGSPF